MSKVSRSPRKYRVYYGDSRGIQITFEAKTTQQALVFAEDFLKSPEIKRRRMVYELKFSRHLPEIVYEIVREDGRLVYDFVHGVYE